MTEKKEEGSNNLFKRLTRLFKSGPVVRRKIRTVDTTVALPDRTKSSAVQLFQRSIGPSYSHITANAYNMQERMARYQDFTEMEQTAEISSALDLFCLAGNNLIPLLDGRKITIKELYENKETDFEVYSYDIQNNKIIPGKCEKVLKTGENQKIYRVNFHNNSYVRLTENHLVLCTNGIYKKVKELFEGDLIKSLYKTITNENSHIVTSIVEDGIEDVYDLCVTDWHNFAVICDHSNNDYVFVHNSDETCASDENGRSLHVYSNNPKIKSLIEDLMYNTLNVEFNMRPWARNLVKYGDMVLYNDVSPTHGVVNIIPIPINEIEREEGYDKEDPMAVRFRWVSLGNKVLENWEITHMRLLGNDMFLPYGSSVLEGARRIWRQLILIEDAMLVYRIVRSPERRVFYIDVGNTPTDEIPHYLEQAKAALRTNQVIDKTTGRVDLRYNSLPIHKDTPIPLLDGRSITIEELSKEHDSGKENWVYSIQDETKKLVPGRVVWCGKNYKAKKLVKVWLDDESYVITAPEHPFVMRNGMSKRADELSVDDLLMPLYRKLSSVNDGDKIKDYELVYDPSTQKYVYTHTMSSNDWYHNHGGYTVKNRRVIHHVDFKKQNNNPTNLQEMSWSDHRFYHMQHCEKTLNSPEQLKIRGAKLAEYNKTEAHRTCARNTVIRDQRAQKMGLAYNGTELHKSHNKIRKEAQVKSWNENKESRSKGLRWILTDEFFEKVNEKIKEYPTLNAKELHQKIINDENILQILRSSQTTKRDVKKLSHSKWVNELKSKGICTSWSDYRITILGLCYKNHKIVAIEIIDDETDVYCMTVVGTNNEEDRHNFAIQSINKDGTVNKNGVFVKNSVDQDFFIATRGNESNTKIETLQGGQNVAAVEDVQYIQRKLFAALKVPKAYLGYEEALCIGKNERIQLLNGTSPTIEELANRKDANNLEDIWVWSTDESGNVIPSRMLRAWKTKDVNELYKITLDNDYEIQCTGNHPFLGRDGNYYRADELQIEQLLCSIDIKNLNYIDRKVSKIELIKLEVPQPVYDVEIENTHNFGLVASNSEVPSLIVVHNSSKASLAQMDIRFSRTINMIQRTIISELNKVAIIHLYANGFEGDDLLNFTIRLSNPSTVAQQQKFELYRTKFEIAGTVPEGLLSRDWIRRNILCLSDEEIIEIERELLEDATAQDAIEAAAQGGGSGGGGGGGGGFSSGGSSSNEPLELGAPGEMPTVGGEEEIPELPGEEEEEELPPENAGQNGSNKPLMLDNDDPEPFGAPLRLSMRDEDGPVKVMSQLQKTLYNNGRHRTHGASKTHMPNFAKMTSHKGYDMQDPYDSASLRTISRNPLSNGRADESKKLTPGTIQPSMSKDISEMLNKLSQKWNRVQSNQIHGSPLLTEIVDNIDDIEIFIDDDDFEKNN